MPEGRIVRVKTARCPKCWRTCSYRMRQANLPGKRKKAALEKQPGSVSHKPLFKEQAKF